MFLLRKLSGKYELSATSQGSLGTSSHAEDDHSKQVVDQASNYVREGNYEKALWLLEKLGQLEPAVKGVAELMAVAEVSYAAVWRSCSCLSKGNRNPDWYKILKVDEKSELSVIKKRYHHLALLLHPDKNKHVKAEAAFKLVSEAYACLSDKKKRENFDVKRSLTKCRRCSARNYISSDPDRWSSYHVFKEKKTGFQRAGNSSDVTEVDWILDQERLRIFRARARARVFRNLARAHKERGFTGAEEVSVRKERSYSSAVKQETMSYDQHQCKKIINDTNTKRKEKSNSNPEPSPMTSNNEMGKESMGDGNHAMKSRPYKNLGVLIHDLQADLVVSIERKREQKHERKYASNQSSTLENVLEMDSRDLGSRVQEGAEALNTELGAGAEETFVHHNAMNAAGKNHSVPSANTYLYLNGDASSTSDFVSKSCSNKGYSVSDKRREVFIKFESDSLIELETKQKDKGKYCSKTAQENEDGESSVSKELNGCRRTSRTDSLDLEETILQTQKEKSEQLLKTLQRLREETKMVAASLDIFCSGCCH